MPRLRYSDRSDRLKLRTNALPALHSATRDEGDPDALAARIVHTLLNGIGAR
jgi:hypothetical protein